MTEEQIVAAIKEMGRRVTLARRGGTGAEVQVKRNLL